ncbi:MAG: hypothetical protein IPJ40_03120 [Saprospirales bacterium]|nr:hypothetical protein [Saprospirales bacterium]
MVRQFLAVKKAQRAQSGKGFYNIPGIVGLATVLVGVPLLWADGIGFIISLIGAGVCLIALLIGSILKWRGNIFATLGLIGFGVFFLVLAIVFSGF